MSKYAITVNGRLTNVSEIPSPLPAWAATVDAFLAKMFPGMSGWKAVNDDAQNGTIDNGDGTYTNPTIPTPPSKPPTISRPRFDSIFAQGCGELYYNNALTALEAIAATSPATEGSALIKRCLKAINNPPPDGIDFPLSGDWAENPSALDLTGSLLYAVKEALKNVGGFSDIEEKIDASLAIWKNLKA